MPGWLRLALGAVLTAGLCYASWWVWTWAERSIRGTPFGDFKLFGSVLAVFVLLSAAQLAIELGSRVLAWRSGRAS